MTPQAKRLTPEELMQPRYEVIADYPGSFEAVGEVITITENILTVSAQQRLRYDKYPGIYRRLDWWEHRKPEEMPEYVSYISLTLKDKFGDDETKTRKYEKVTKWRFRKSPIGICNSDPQWYYNDSPFSTLCHSHLPATLQDYTQYINSLK